MAQPVIVTKNIVTSNIPAGVDLNNGTYKIIGNQRLPSNSPTLIPAAQLPTGMKYDVVFEQPQNPVMNGIIQPVIDSVLFYQDYSPEAVAAAQKVVDADKTSPYRIQKLYTDTYKNLVVPSAEKYSAEMERPDRNIITDVRAAVHNTIRSIPASIPALMMGVADIGRVQKGAGSKNFTENTFPNLIEFVKENPAGAVASLGIGLITAKAAPPLLKTLKPSSTPGVTLKGVSPSTPLAQSKPTIIDSVIDAKVKQKTSNTGEAIKSQVSFNTEIPKITQTIESGIKQSNLNSIQRQQTAIPQSRPALTGATSDIFQGIQRGVRTSDIIDRNLGLNLTQTERRGLTALRNTVGMGNLPINDAKIIIKTVRDRNKAFSESLQPITLRKPAALIPERVTLTGGNRDVFSGAERGVSTSDIVERNLGMRLSLPERDWIKSIKNQRSADRNNDLLTIDETKYLITETRKRFENAFPVELVRIKPAALIPERVELTGGNRDVGTVYLDNQRGFIYPEENNLGFSLSPNERKWIKDIEKRRSFENNNNLLTIDETKYLITETRKRFENAFPVELVRIKPAALIPERVELTGGNRDVGTVYLDNQRGFIYPEENNLGFSLSPNERKWIKDIEKRRSFENNNNLLTIDETKYLITETRKRFENAFPVELVRIKPAALIPERVELTGGNRDVGTVYLDNQRGFIHPEENNLGFSLSPAERKDLKAMRRENGGYLSIDEAKYLISERRKWEAKQKIPVVIGKRREPRKLLPEGKVKEPTTDELREIELRNEEIMKSLEAAEDEAKETRNRLGTTNSVKFGMGKKTSEKTAGKTKTTRQKQQTRKETIKATPKTPAAKQEILKSATSELKKDGITPSKKSPDVTVKKVTPQKDGMSKVDVEVTVDIPQRNGMVLQQKMIQTVKVKTPQTTTQKTAAKPAVKTKGKTKTAAKPNGKMVTAKAGELQKAVSKFRGNQSLTATEAKLIKSVFGNSSLNPTKTQITRMQKTAADIFRAANNSANYVKLTSNESALLGAFITSITDATAIKTDSTKKVMDGGNIPDAVPDTVITGTTDTKTTPTQITPQSVTNTTDSIVDTTTSDTQTDDEKQMPSLLPLLFFNVPNAVKGQVQAVKEQIPKTQMNKPVFRPRPEEETKKRPARIRNKDYDSDSGKKKKTKKVRKYKQMVYYIPWLSEDDVEADNFSWLKHDLKPMRTPAGIRKAGTPAVKKAVAAYNAAVKAYNTARKKLLKLARAGDKPENKRAYAELKRLYKSAKSLKTAAQKQIKAYKI